MSQNIMQNIKTSILRAKYNSPLNTPIIKLTKKKGRMRCTFDLQNRMSVELI